MQSGGGQRLTQALAQLVRRIACSPSCTWWGRPDHVAEVLGVTMNAAYVRKSRVVKGCAECSEPIMKRRIPNDVVSADEVLAASPSFGCTGPSASVEEHIAARRVSTS
jgi:hypothetical protein